jgi:hypothetical protein
MRPQALSSKPRPQIEALHLANLGFPLMEGDTARYLAAKIGQQQASLRGSIVTRQFRELAVKILKAKAKVQGKSVLAKQFPHRGQFDRRLGLENGETNRSQRTEGWFRGSAGFCHPSSGFWLSFDYPMSIPPFTFNT